MASQFTGVNPSVRLAAAPTLSVARVSAEAPQTPAIAPPPAPPAEAPAKPAPKRSWKMRVGAGLALLALFVAGYYGHRWWTNGRFIVSTEDAYIQADVTPLIAKANGYILTLRVKDNSAVKRGDVLAEIDPRDYDLAAQTARDRIAAQQATIDRIAAQILAATAAEEQAEAGIAAVEATRVAAQADFARAETLTARQVGSRQTLDTARAARDRAIAEVASAQAALKAAKADVEVTRAQQKEAAALLAQLRTALASAERDLSFTQIKAPTDGVVGNRAVNIGSYVSVGSRIMALVPDDTLYVSANFKETQLASIAPGQEVNLSIDAADDIVVPGHVDSIAPAAGSVFSLLPVENATGNFTKIVQRVPVRIAIAPADVERFSLRPGLSVVAEVDTRTTPSGGAPPSP